MRDEFLIGNLTFTSQQQIEKFFKDEDNGQQFQETYSSGVKGYGFGTEPTIRGCFAPCGILVMAAMAAQRKRGAWAHRNAVMEIGHDEEGNEDEDEHEDEDEEEEEEEEEEVAEEDEKENEEAESDSMSIAELKTAASSTRRSHRTNAITRFSQINEQPNVKVQTDANVAVITDTNIKDEALDAEITSHLEGLQSDPPSTEEDGESNGFDSNLTEGAMRGKEDEETIALVGVVLLLQQEWLGFDCFWDLMRLRSPAMPPLDNMEKGVGKNQHSRLCLVSLLAAFFWFFLLYFHFVVLGGIRPKVDIRREPDVSVTPNFVNTQSSNPVVIADPKLEFSVDHSPVTAQPKPVSHSVMTPPTTPNVFR
ncbi:hypothetical protein RJ639_019904 [Escallonia herrerae]|uniref:Uncharacterized protein n=1 Tax=Escallonia herrerae TaxID=1293975 RepID=A0AA89AKH2_9ASTE|nr:hypothetical protein RJ639_019904 [Escallonia herrerae]